MDLAGSAHLVLAADVVQLDPASAVLEAMLVHSSFRLDRLN